jgi:hypothetical protein
VPLDTEALSFVHHDSEQLTNMAVVLLLWVVVLSLALSAYIPIVTVMPIHF